MDDKITGENELLQEMMEGCLSNRDIIVAMHSAYKKKIASSSFSRACQAQPDELFKAKDLDQLMRMEPDWVISFVVKKSGLTEEQLTKSMKGLAVTPLLLLKYHLQLDNVPLEGALSIKCVFWDWADERGRSVGNRLNNFLTRGGHIDDNFSITFPRACYQFTVEKRGLHDDHPLRHRYRQRHYGIQDLFRARVQLQLVGRQGRHHAGWAPSDQGDHNVLQG